MPGVAELLRDASLRLAMTSPSARLDAELLLSHLLGRPRTFLFSHPEFQPADEVVDAWHELVAKRATGVPVAYLTGHREFHGHDFRVTGATLVPRPDTELLVDAVLDRLPGDEPLRAIDLGTGTGAIALSLALARPRWQVTAVDASETALEVAGENARLLKANNVSCVSSDWWTSVEGNFHLVVSNPPYIAEDDPHLLNADLRHEPRSALVSGRDGLDDIRRILAGASRHLEEGALLAIEHGFEQGEAVRALFASTGLREVETLRDLAGHERVTLGVHHAR